jgi:hypothetical protein
MEIRKANALEKRHQARARNPLLFDRLIEMAQTGSHATCWPVQRGQDKNGYGILRVGGRKTKAHRAMFLLWYPGVAAPVVRHNCNNPACINPAHLRGGTKHDNAIDRMLSGRGGDLKGEKNGRAKLTASDVREIRESTLSGAELGAKFGISKVMACRIKRGQAWAHI